MMKILMLMILMIMMAMTLMLYIILQRFMLIPFFASALIYC